MLTGTTRSRPLANSVDGGMLIRRFPGDRAARGSDAGGGLRRRRSDSRPLLRPRRVARVCASSPMGPGARNRGTERLKA